MLSLDPPPSYLSLFVSPTHSFSALHHAALTGTTELLSLLLEAQATVDIKDINGIMIAEQLYQLNQRLQTNSYLKKKVHAREVSWG